MFMEKEIINSIFKRVNTLEKKVDALEKEHQEFVDRFNSLVEYVAEVIKIDIDDKDDVISSFKEIETILDVHTKAIAKLISDVNKGRKEKKKHATDQ